MPRPRLPARKAEVSGASIKDPGRFKGRKAPARPRPVGNPYEGMTPEQVAIWEESVANMPWLNSGHRLLLRQVCILAARMETDPDMGVSALQALGAALSKLGATPVDETKVMHGDGEEEDPEEGFFSGPPGGRPH